MASLFRIPSSRHLCPLRNREFLDVAQIAPADSLNRRDRIGHNSGRELWKVILARTLTVLLTAALPACAAHRPLNADETFAAANEHFQSEAYEQAITEYKEILDRHPFSKHATEAETKTAQAYYRLGRNAEAIAAFSDFERMHPTHSDVPLATYYLGMSYLKQMRPRDRDQSASVNAHAYFQAVIDRYPTSAWAARARLRLRECNEALASHELYVAQFYLQHEGLAPAEARLQRLLETYPHTEAAAQALDQFAETYVRRELRTPAILALQSLIELHPDNPLSDRAVAALSALADDPDSPEMLLTEDPLEHLLLCLAARTSGNRAAPPADVSNLLLTGSKNEPPFASDSSPDEPRDAGTY